MVSVYCVCAASCASGVMMILFFVMSCETVNDTFGENVASSNDATSSSALKLIVIGLLRLTFVGGAIGGGSGEPPVVRKFSTPNDASLVSPGSHATAGGHAVSSGAPSGPH